jgi:hypothetical protein
MREEPKRTRVFFPPFHSQIPSGIGSSSTISISTPSGPSTQKTAEAVLGVGLDGVNDFNSQALRRHEGGLDFAVGKGELADRPPLCRLEFLKKMVFHALNRGVAPLTALPELLGATLISSCDRRVAECRRPS